MTKENKIILLRFIQIIFDFCLLSLMHIFSYFLCVGFIFSTDLPFLKFFIPSLYSIFSWIFILIFFLSYQINNHKISKQIFYILFAGIIAIALMNNVYFFSNADFFARRISIFTYFFSSVFLILNFYIFRKIEIHLQKNGTISLNTLILGSDRETEEIIKKIILDPICGLLPVAILTATGSKKKDILGIPIIGKFDRIEKTIHEKKIEAIFHCDSVEHSLNIASISDEKFLKFFINPNIFGIFNGKFLSKKIDKKIALELERTKLKGFYKFFKNCFDFVLSIFFIIFLSPVFLIFYIFSKKVFETEKRIGENGKSFLLYRFYTGNDKRKFGVKESIKWRNDKKISTFSQFLRKSFLSEIPQILNVLKGEMSFFGPRPPSFTEFEKYQSFFKRRVFIKPGIIGLWQIRVLDAKKELSFDKMFLDDINYISNWGFILDLKIFFKFVFVFFKKKTRDCFRKLNKNS